MVYNMTEQKNAFIFECKDVDRVISNALSFIYRQTEKILYPTDLYSSEDMGLIVTALSIGMRKGDHVRAYFINGERSKGMYITQDGTKSIRTNEFYSRFHPTGVWTYQDAMAGYHDYGL